MLEHSRTEDLLPFRSTSPGRWCLRGPSTPSSTSCPTSSWRPSVTAARSSSSPTSRWATLNRNIWSHCYRRGRLSLQSYISAHPGTVLLDPLPAMTQLLDRFASYRIMTKLHNSLRGHPQPPPVRVLVVSAATLVTAVSCCVHQTGGSAALRTWRSTARRTCRLSNRL